MSEQEVYYKVLSPDNKAQNGGDFDYTEYLPKQKKDGSWKPGKWLPKTKVVLCVSGWHITKYWNMWIESEQDNIYEVEYKNKQSDNNCSVELKIACEQIRLIKKIDFKLDGDCNTGNWNTGYRHSGYFNTEKHKSPIMMFGRLYDGDIPFFPSWLFVVEMTKECWLKSFNDAPLEELKQTLQLPNFDYDIFEEITGISKKMFNKRLK